MSTSLMRNTSILSVAWLAFAGFLLVGCSEDPAPGEAGVASSTVSGPISGGLKGRPFTSALLDLSSYGYVEEEYFIEGTANTYGPASNSILGPDGRWDVGVTGTQPYKSRFLVRRPTDATKFNGTVVVEWMQSSAGFDKDVNWNWQRDEFLRGGYVWVGVSAQREGVDGSPTDPVQGGFQDLVRWDTERYGSLGIPSEDLAYDIFTQVGEAVGSGRSTDFVDPLAGLEVREVLPIGDTFAAEHLVTYYNAVQPLAQVFDGFFIGWRHISSSTPLSAGIEMPNVVKLRTDLDVPVIVVNSAAEAVAHYPARQPNSDVYRLWEIAGSAHTNAFWAPQMYAIMNRDFDMPLPQCEGQFNTVPNQYVMNAAVSQLVRWVRGQSSPPELPPLDVAGTPLALVQDEFGNTTGGVRLPEVVVPIARYEAGGDRRCPADSGYTHPFLAEVLISMYPTHDDYVSKYQAAVQVAVESGILVPADAEEALKNAMLASVPR